MVQIRRSSGGGYVWGLQRARGRGWPGGSAAAQRARTGLVLLEAEGEAAAGQVVWGEFDENAVPGENLDIVLAHLTADVGQHFVAVCEFDAECGAGERLGDDAFYFQGICF